jgi:hypothetical protein
MIYQECKVVSITEIRLHSNADRLDKLKWPVERCFDECSAIRAIKEGF